MERRLSAIMAADVVGYSRLMGENEVGTLTALKQHRSELIDPAIAKHRGRTFKLTGDGMLIEFSSVVSAVECAADIQREMRHRNVAVPEDRRIEFRVGIDLGDVIVIDDDIFGEGVNVASRLEAVARPGGIAVSGSVRDYVGNKTDLEFVDAGAQELKNIAAPVQVYSIVLAAGAPGADGAAPQAASDADRPSIAVLPFNNMSDEPGQEYFSDGITEDIITDLSKISGLFVVGRNTAFTYKGKSVQLQQVATELGVKFLLEGSVRKSGQRVRVTGQLIDGTSGGHLWADRYDRDLTDIFAIQDEITRAIVDQLKIRLLPKERTAIDRAPTANVEAYTYYLKGRQFCQNLTKSFLILARQMFTKAVELDPDFARAYAGIAVCGARLLGAFGEPIPGEEILAVAAKALALDPNLAEGHAAHGDALSAIGRGDDAKLAYERGLQLDPDSFDANYSFARFLFRTNDHERAAALYKRAVELQPDNAEPALMLSLVLTALKRDEEALEYSNLGLKRAEAQLRQYPESSRPAQLGACVLAAIGETERAKKWMELALEIDPDDRIALYNAACMWSNLGEVDRALDYLERWSGVAARDGWEWIEHDPDIDPLRSHPRYQKLIAENGVTLSQAASTTGGEIAVTGGG